jgi:hypothetical protein
MSYVKLVPGNGSSHYMVLSDQPIEAKADWSDPAKIDLPYLEIEVIHRAAQPDDVPATELLVQSNGREVTRLQIC